MNPDMMARLRDIQGLEPTSWWPLAPGWWVVAVLVLVIVFSLYTLLRNLRRYPAGSWRRHAWKQLRILRQQAQHMPAQQLAGELSELLRRIAIARLGRNRTAGLSGERWLACLKEHDPAGFDWRNHGRPLITLPYAPPDNKQNSSVQLLPLIDAALVWVNYNNERQHA